MSSVVRYCIVHPAILYIISFMGFILRFQIFTCVILMFKRKNSHNCTRRTYTYTIVKCQYRHNLALHIIKLWFISFPTIFRAIFVGLMKNSEHGTIWTFVLRLSFHLIHHKKCKFVHLLNNLHYFVVSKFDYLNYIYEFYRYCVKKLKLNDSAF